MLFLQSLVKITVNSSKIHFIWEDIIQFIPKMGSVFEFTSDIIPSWINVKINCYCMLFIQINIQTYVGAAVTDNSEHPVWFTNIKLLWGWTGTFLISFVFPSLIFACLCFSSFSNTTGSCWGLLWLWRGRWTIFVGNCISISNFIIFRS